MVSMKGPDQYWEVFNMQFADFDRRQDPIDNFEPSCAADRSRLTTARNCRNAQFARQICRDYRKARCGIQHEMKLLFNIPQGYRYQRTVICPFDRYNEVIRAGQFEPLAFRF